MGEVGPPERIPLVSLAPVVPLVPGAAGGPGRAAAVAAAGAAASVLWLGLALLALLLLAGGGAAGEGGPPMATTAYIDRVAPSPAYDTQELFFSGHGEADEGAIIGYQWRSGLEGLLSRQANFSLTGLSAGNHSLTFRVRNESGEWSDNATAWLEVGHNEPPRTVDLNLSAGWVYRGTNLTLYATGSDDITPPEELTPEFEMLGLPPWTPTSEFPTSGATLTHAISGDGSLIAYGIATATASGRVVVVDWQRGMEIWNFTLAQSVVAVALSVDGRYLATGGDEGDLRLFELANQTLVWNYQATASVASVALSANGSYLAAGLYSGELMLFEGRSSTPVRNISLEGNLLSVALSADGTYIAAGTGSNNGNRALIYHREQEQPLLSYPTLFAISSVSLSADGRWLAAGSSYLVYLLERETGDLVWDYFTIEGGGPYLRVALSADASTVAVGSMKAGQTVRLLDAVNGHTFWSYNEPDRIFGIALADDINRMVLLVANASDWTKSRVTIRDRVEPPRFSNPEFVGDRWQVNLTPPINAPLGNYSLRVRFTDGQGAVSPWLTQWDSLTLLNRPPSATILPPEVPAYYDTLTYRIRGTGNDPDGLRLISGYRWYLDSLEGDDELEGDSELVFNPPGPGNYTLMLRTVDGEGGWSEPASYSFQVLANAPPKVTGFNLSAAVVYRGEGLNLTVAGEDDSAPPGDWLLEVEYMAGPAAAAGAVEGPADDWSYGSLSGVSELALSANGDYLAVAGGGSDPGVYLFNQAEAGAEPLWRFATSTPVISLELAPAGDYLVAATASMVYLFHSRSPSPVWSFEPTGPVSRLALSGDGGWVAFTTSWPDSRVYLVARATGELQWSRAIEGKAPKVAISYDGNYLAVGGRNLTLLDREGALFWFRSSPGFQIEEVTISQNGEYIIVVASSLIYIFQHQNSTVPWVIVPEGLVKGMKISDDGSLLVIITSTQLEVYQLDNYQRLWTYTVATVPTDLALSATGDRIALATYDRVLVFDRAGPEPVWNLSLDWSTNRQVALAGNGLSLAVGDDGVALHRFWAGAGLEGGELVEGRWQARFTVPLEGGLGNYSFRVRLSDGQGGVGAWYYPDASLQVLNRPPVARLPDPGQGRLQVDQGEYLEGQGSDADGTLAAYRWRSSVDGELGGGERLDTGGLTPGNQTLYLAVRDNDGAWSGEAGVEVAVNGRPTATIVSFPVAPVLRGGVVEFVGGGEDEPQGGVVAHRWRVGPRVYLLEPGEPLRLNTSLLEPGNHSVTFAVQDTGGAWSVAAPAWLYVNTQPTAQIMGVERVMVKGETTVTLWGVGRDEGRVVQYQWRSNRDGVLGNGSLLVVGGLSAGDHLISLRVKDDTGLWSEWVQGPRPLTVEAGPPVPRWTFLTQPTFYLALMVAYLMVVGTWMATRPLRHRWLATQVHQPTRRLWRHQDRFISLGLELEFPRHRFRQALEPLAAGRFRHSRERLHQLEAEVEATLSLYEVCYRQRRRLHRLTRQLRGRRLRRLCPQRRLQRLEYLWLVRRLKEYREQSATLLMELAEAGVKERRGLPPSGLRRRGPRGALHRLGTHRLGRLGLNSRR